MAQFTEEEQLMRRITKHFRKGVVNYRLIDDGDVILVGLSGGKDSLALLELLAARARIHRPHFQVRAVHVCMTNIPYQSDVEYLRSFCEALDVPFQVYETSFDPTTDTRKSPCFLCSWN
ncbi:MAG: tRNA 2-thiocytidine(32) synthetase TtcA, partial [Bacteroidaceae bacterium]|nr:tRNA 2-thiocytidine(32) synthetase TtcA [Bacteroidaceae bacterium]